MLQSWKVIVKSPSKQYTWHVRYVVGPSKASAMRQAKRLVGYDADEAQTRAGIRECISLENLTVC